MWHIEINNVPLCVCPELSQIDRETRKMKFFPLPCQSDDLEELAILRNRVAGIMRHVRLAIVDGPCPEY